MAFAAVYDACVLYSSVTRDVVRTAIMGTVRAHRTATILDEVRRNLLANRPDITPEQHDRMGLFPVEGVVGVGALMPV